MGGAVNAFRINKSCFLLLCGLLLIATVMSGLAKENSPIKKGGKKGRGGRRTKDPIQIVTGNNMYDVTDIYIPCPLIDLNFSRSYNSQLLYDGIMGARWCHSYDWRLYISPTSILLQAVVDLGLGAYMGDLHHFQKDETGSFYILGDTAYRLFEEQDGGYSLLVPGGLVRRFDTNGVLSNITHPAGQSVTLHYTGTYPTQQLARVEHTNGQYLDFEYEGGLLAHVRTPSENLYVSFSYDVWNTLTNASLHTKRGVFSEVYDYGASDGFRDRCLRRRVGPDGTEFRFDYIVADGESSLCTGMHAGPERRYEVKLRYTLPYAELVEAGSGTGPFNTDIRMEIVGSMTNAVP